MIAFLASTSLARMREDVLMSFKFLKPIIKLPFGVASYVTTLLLGRAFSHSPKFFRPPLSEIHLER